MSDKIATVTTLLYFLTSVIAIIGFQRGRKADVEESDEKTAKRCREISKETTAPGEGDTSWTDTGSDRMGQTITITITMSDNDNVKLEQISKVRCVI